MSLTSEMIIAGIEKVTSEPYKFVRHIHLLGGTLYQLEVDEVNTAAKNNVEMLFGHLFATFPEISPPVLDETNHIKCNKQSIVDHYSNAYRASHDMTARSNVESYFRFKKTVEDLVEEFLPKTLWKPIHKKYKDLYKVVEETGENYSERPDIAAVFDEVEEIKEAVVSRLSEHQVNSDNFRSAFDEVILERGITENKEILFEMVEATAMPLAMLSSKLRNVEALLSAILGA